MFINNSNSLHALGGYDSSPAIETGGIGFRIAAVPEPSSLVLLSLGGLVLLKGRRRA